MGSVVSLVGSETLAVYTAMESDLRAAQALSIILVVAAFVLLFILRRVAPGAELPGSELRGA